MIRVLVAGEVSNELGPLQPPADFGEGRRDSGGGVVEELMAKVRSTGWKIVEAMVWRDVPKLRVGARGHEDKKTVAALALRAREKGCNALIFLRDRDGEAARERAIDTAVAEIQPGLHVAGGVPMEKLEHWLLALKGEESAHCDANPEDSLEVRYRVPRKRVTAMVQLVRNSSIRKAAPDAQSLRTWLRKVAVALSVTIPREWP